MRSSLAHHFLEGIPEKLKVIQDFGANTGEFSCIAAKHCDLLVSQDIDPVAVELNFRKSLADGPTNSLANIAKLSVGITRWLVIEFVPKSDAQLMRLLATREDIFGAYTQEKVVQPR
jgi:ribosomal protein L11 methylase PrmA